MSRGLLLFLFVSFLNVQWFCMLSCHTIVVFCFSKSIVCVLLPTCFAAAFELLGVMMRAHLGSCPFILVGVAG